MIGYRQKNRRGRLDALSSAALCLRQLRTRIKDWRRRTAPQGGGTSMMKFYPGEREQGERFEYEFGRLSALVADMSALRGGAAPGILTGEEPPFLGGWGLAQRPVPCLVGLSSGHPRLFGSGRPIATSDLWLMSADQSWARSLSRWYRLGRPAGHHS